MDAKTVFKHRLELEVTSTDQPNPSTGSPTFIGTATVLIHWGGLTILTDPNFLHKSDHVHLGLGITAERLTNPAIEMDELPPIDLVVLSHFHEDHFDRLVQERFDKSVPILTTPSAANELSKLGFLAPFALEKWETALVSKGPARLCITAMPAQHSPAIPLDFVLPETMGSILQFCWAPEESQAQLETATVSSVLSTSTFKLYISGDTLLVDDLKEIPRRYTQIDLGLFHLGGTTIGLGLFVVTMDAIQGAACIKLIKPRTAIPIHFNDYDVFKSSLGDFKIEAEKQGVAKDVELVYLDRGDTYEFYPRIESDKAMEAV